MTYPESNIKIAEEESDIEYARRRPPYEGTWHFQPQGETLADFQVLRPLGTWRAAYLAFCRLLLRLEMRLGCEVRVRLGVALVALAVFGAGVIVGVEVRF